MTTATTCWNCGFENQSGAKFCANCGKSQRQPCPECGADVPEGSRFCPNCGIPLASRPQPAAGSSGPVLTAETRRVITVLFADLVGSTGLTERLDPEEARDVIKKFYDVAQHIVERWYEGSIANYLGDGVLAVFGLPAAHENDPERAVRAGLAIRDAMPNLNDHLRTTHGIQLSVRVGINTGEVVAASGSTFDRDFLISDAVTTAARLQQAVPAGTVVIGERTYRLTKDSIEYRELPPLEVKGKDAPLPVWAGVAPLPETVDVRRITAPLVGRHAELGLLRHLYERSRDANLVQLVTILGQTGVGKSRLLREFLAVVRETDNPPMVLRGRSIAFGSQIGYHALLDILRGQAGLLDTDSPDLVRSKIRDWLHELLPGRDDLVDGMLLTFGTGEIADDPSLVRQRLFSSWKDLVVGLADARPVVLALEDLHWADDGVLDLIQLFAEASEGSSLFIICLARPELLERRPTWPGARRDSTNIELPPLRQHEAEQLAAALSSEALTSEVRQTVALRAGGNPLFVEELVRMLLEGSAPGAAIPETVQAVITARLDRLPANERRTLQAAAVIGRAFWPSAVAPIAGLPVEEVPKTVEALISKELVISRPRSAVSGEREFAFRHILTRDIAYAMLPKAQRQRAHAEAARWLEARAGERSEEVVEILAEHLHLAGDAARAAIYFHRAANKARRLYANADAISLFERALGAAEAAGRPAQQLAEISRDRGDVHQLLGHYDLAMTDFQRGLVAARQARDLRQEAGLENRIGLIFHRQLELDEAERHFTSAIALAREAGERLTLGRSLVDLANIAWDRGRMDPTHPALVEGLTLLREDNDLSGLARALNLMCMGQTGAGNGELAIAAAQQALEAARAAGDKSRTATSLSYLSVVHGFLGRYAEALPYAEDAIRLAEEIGDRRRITYTHFFIGRVLVNWGHWGDAVQHLELGRRMGMARITEPWSYYFLGLAYHMLGDSERAKTIWTEGSHLEARSPAWKAMALLSGIGAARLSQETATLDRLLGEMLAMPFGIFIPSDAETLLPAGEALLDLGRAHDAQGFLDARRAGVQKLDAPPHLASMAILDAQLAVRRGDKAKALQNLDRAVQWSLRSEDAIREWRARELRLTLSNRNDDRDALRTLIQRIASGLTDEHRRIFMVSPRTVAALGEEQHSN